MISQPDSPLQPEECTHVINARYCVKSTALNGEGKGLIEAIFLWCIHASVDFTLTALFFIGCLICLCLPHYCFIGLVIQFVVLYFSGVLSVYALD